MAELSQVFQIVVERPWGPGWNSLASLASNLRTQPIIKNPSKEGFFIIGGPDGSSRSSDRQSDVFTLRNFQKFRNCLISQWVGRVGGIGLRKI